MLEIKKINFVSFIKLCAVIACSWGIVLGLLLFISSIFGGNVYCNFGSIHITGVIAGIMNMFLFPIIITIGGILLSVVIYLPFKFINAYVLKGIKLKGVFNIIEENKDLE
ncbi:hypothetical protein [Tepidibacter hydrothermalis]|uniref:Uncharacterized protein n=1 Tax=Tepidibacter hydrothermalis TaxID=3036126 RepID=A0ABY8EFQ2_9FIRM|nr:hypothetical protein [Tepidibacter hydrothermalis]WFD11784.1 hypothetical protein P4S50_06830 [Tepidibacter hydrothermalis]